MSIKISTTSLQNLISIIEATVSSLGLEKKWENGDEINNAPLLDVIFLQMQIYNGKAIIFLSRIFYYILNSVQDQLIGY